MYRYSVDRAVTYTSEDMVLFRESPFASWMERLTLENPEHGIAPDAYSPPPVGYVQRQDELAATLRDEGKHVALIDWDAEEPVRRAATLDAMRRGTDYIVNGQLALGSLSGSVNLLMRTSGYSQLGNYLYIPCDTQAKTTLNSAFRLCFVADLLHSLQGQLPPQMLVIRGDADLLQLHTEDHIYHYRAVKQRFMAAMRDFSKQQMPEPAESSHFGRWSAFAHETLKQRVLREEHELAVQAGVETDSPALDLVTTAAITAPESSNAQPQPRIAARGIPVGDTLAAQARQLQKKASYSDLDDDAIGAPPPKVGLDAALENLEFIGSSGRTPRIGEGNSARAPAGSEGSPAAASAVVESPTPPAQLRRKTTVARSRPAAEPARDFSDSAVQEPVPAPRLNTHSREFEVDCIDDSDYQLPAAAIDAAPAHTASADAVSAPQARVPVYSSSPGETLKTTRPFSSSLNTSNFPEEPR
ncbi:hypothetical protein [Pseudohalioglobus lutimaris]|uniref:Uncharacterized protein n=1 Tax=Pseudohalioglobus lutimaris TaxID=1737061 RepID=A0A2N5X4J3_9GAMM|nr:hypothetical protein [Pseudohalioglobus lutimaris]PLW69392.1 hypothetical protein C0039_07630 [Pseudohalioglobus lutimaris]